MDQHGRKRRADKSQRTQLKPRKATRGGSRHKGLSRLLGLFSLALMVVAAVLLVNYIIQGNRTRHMQEEQRALYQQAQGQRADATQGLENSSTSLGQTQAVPGEGEQNSIPTDLANEAKQLAVETHPQGEVAGQHTTESHNMPLGAQTPTADQQAAQAAQDQQPASSLAASLSAGEAQAMADRFLPLWRRNQDVVGWLSYPMFREMDFAVVHRDNDYYMYRGFTGEDNIAGTVFMDQSNGIRPRDQNLILHGHNMKNGTMFGRLNRLMEPAILAAEPFITFDTLYQDTVYVPYAITIFSVSPDSPQYFDAIAPNFADTSEMGEYVNWLRQRSTLVFPTQVASQDRLLTLITCHGSDDNERLALALRAVRPGEDIAALKASMQQGIVRR